MLGYLLNPFIQVADTDGKPVPGAKIYVYMADTTNPATTYSDFEGTENPFPVLSDLLGNANVIAASDVLYDIVVNYPDDTLIFSKKGVGVSESSGAIPGVSQVVPGNGILVTGTASAPVVSIDPDTVATQEDLATKMDNVTAGDNISIENGVISVTDRSELVGESPIVVTHEPGLTVVSLDPSVDFHTEVLAGTDLAVSTSGNSVTVSVDTDSTTNGFHDFVAGTGNVIDDYTGNALVRENAVFGLNNTVSGESVQRVFVAGAANNIGSSVDAAIFGYGNRIDSLVGSRTYRTIIGGSYNTVTGATADTIVVGEGIRVFHGGENAVFGYGHTLDSNYENLVGGSNNELRSGANYNVVGGNHNVLTGNYVSSNAVFGSHNTVTSDTSIIGGSSNTAYGMIGSIMVGNDNALPEYTGNYYYGAVIGESNVVSTWSNTVAAGRELFLLGARNANLFGQASQTFLLGDGNRVSGTSANIHGSFLVGTSNSVTEATMTDTILAGQSNSVISTTTVATILAGMRNTVANSGQLVATTLMGSGNSVKVSAPQNAGDGNFVGGLSNNIDVYVLTGNMVHGRHISATGSSSLVMQNNAVFGEDHVLGGNNLICSLIAGKANQVNPQYGFINGMVAGGQNTVGGTNNVVNTALLGYNNTLNLDTGSPVGCLIAGTTNAVTGTGASVYGATVAGFGNCIAAGSTGQLDGQVAIGKENYLSGNHSFAVGAYNHVESQNAGAFGWNNRVSIIRAVAFGIDQEIDTSNTVRIGVGNTYLEFSSTGGIVKCINGVRTNL